MKKNVLLLTLFLIITCGCEPKQTGVTGGDEPISKAAQIEKYLNDRNVPAIQSVRQWQNQYGPGLEISTRHYDIFTTLLDPLILTQVPGFMEACHQAYQSQLPEPIVTQTRFTVYLFETRRQWEDFTKTFTPAQAEMYSRIKSGAYYLNGSCVTYNIGRDKTFSVLAHEAWHQFNSRHFKYRLPSWLDEGIAMQFESFREKAGTYYFEPEKNLQRLAGLKKTLDEGKMIPLEILISINPGEVIMAEGDSAVIAFYSQSYALVRFLREEGYGKRLASYKSMLFDGLKGNWPLQGQAKQIASDRNIELTVGWNRLVGRYLFEHYIGDDFQNLQQEYTYFCRKIVYHVRLR
jgi:hypothetical protein